MMKWSRRPLLEGSMRTKRFVCLLSALAFFFCLAAPVSTMAESVQSAQQAFQLSEDGNALIKYHGSASFVSVPDGVRVIRGGAFAGNRNVVTVYLPDSVAEIEGGAFENCANLQNIITSGMSKLSVIGSNAFAGCPLLNTSFMYDIVDGDISDSAFYQPTAAPTVQPAQPGATPTVRPGSRPAATASPTPVPVSGASPYDDFRITRQPVSVQAAEGDYVAFTVSAVGRYAVLLYQWQRSSDGEKWEDINSRSTAFRGVTTDTLGFAVTRGSAKLMYRCVVIDGNRALSSDAVSVLVVEREPVPQIEFSAATENQALYAPSTIGAWQETATSAIIIWSPAEQAQSYALYRSMNGGKPELIKILTDYSYTDTGLDFLGNDYSYSVASLMTLPNSEKTVRSELSDSAQVEKISTVQNGAELNGVGYTITPDGAVVTGYKGRATALTIPPTIPVGNKTYTVIGIGPDVFRGNKTLKTISLPNTIRVIETGAFAYCNAMIDH